MRILILNWRDPRHPFAGGAEKSVLEHAKFWRKKGARITWFAASFEGASKEEVMDGIKIVRRGNHYTVHLYFIAYCLLGRFKDIDLVVDCFHFIPFFSPIFMKKYKKVAIVQERAGKLWFKNLMFPFSLVGYLMEPLFFHLYKNVQFITGSESAKNEVAQMGIKEKNITVIHHGVDRLKILGKKEKNPTVLYLGLLSKDKGFEDACEAVSLVKKQITNINFLIAGKEQKEGDYNWYAGKVKKFAKYFGYVSEKQKFELLKKSWVLINPSEKEGWGLTVIEAATQGTPTIGYNVPGLRDSIRDGKTGLLSQKNPRALAKKIISLLENKVMLKEMSEKAYVWSRNFDWKKSTEQSWFLISKIYG